MDKPRFNEVIIVEGKYDAAMLSNVVDALIITTDGFSVFSKAEVRELIKSLGRERGLIILTDSDAAGFKIRNYINNFASGVPIKNAYMPCIAGKEARKARPSKEGLLGVEGASPEVILSALSAAGVRQSANSSGSKITHSDLYNLGISGTSDSAQKRLRLLKRLGLPLRLSKNAMCGVLSAMYTYEELWALCESQPVIFWDFHGTITLPDSIWYTAALQALIAVKYNSLPSVEAIRTEFYKSKMPWWSCEEKTARCACAQAWWHLHEEELKDVYIRCGIPGAVAAQAAPYLQKIIMDKNTHRLYDGVHDILKKLSERGYRQCLLSSNFPYLKVLTDKLELTQYFEHIISSADIGVDKPFVEFYKKALEIAGVQPQNAVMIGDNPENDIAPASAVGMKTIAVNRAFGTGGATWQCKTITEVLTVLR